MLFLPLLFTALVAVAFFPTPLCGVPLLKNIQLSRPTTYAINVSSEGVGSGSTPGSSQQVWFAWPTDTDTTNINSFEVLDILSSTYGPGVWSITQELSEKWIIQTSEVAQLIVNPVTMAVAKNPYRGTYAIIGSSTWSDIVVDVEIRSQTVNAHSTGIVWRFVDVNNHYLFVVNLDCGISKVVRMGGFKEVTLGTGPVVIIDNYLFGSEGNYPVANDKNEFAYVLGTKLEVCDGNCLSNTDCSGSLVCLTSDGKSPLRGCVGPGTEGWGYCVITVHRPPEDASIAGFLELTSLSLHSGSDLNKCQGDCDTDRNCLGSMVCLLREGTALITGCSGLGEAHWDYCSRERSEPTFAQQEGPPEFSLHDGHVLEFRNKDSVKTSAYVLHVETSSGCDADADLDILAANYRICGWVKVGQHYNGVHQIFATSFWNKQNFVGHISSLPFCDSDATCQRATDSIVPFQQLQRDQWHYVCDEYKSIDENTPITSLDIFFGWPQRASQGFVQITGVSVERRPANAPPLSKALNIFKLTEQARLNFQYSLRITHMDNNIQVEINGMKYIDVSDDSPLAFDAGKVSLYCAGNANCGFKNFNAYPVRGSKVFTNSPVLVGESISLVNMSSPVLETVTERVLIMMRGCPNISSAESCGDLQTFSTAPPDPPTNVLVTALDNGAGVRVQIFRPSNERGSPLTHYNISYQPANRTASSLASSNDHPVMFNVVDQADMLEAVISELTEAETIMFEFSVAACSFAGCGEAFFAMTGPPSVVRSMSIRNENENDVTSQSLLIRFLPPHISGGRPVSHYTAVATPVFNSVPVVPQWIVSWLDGVPSISISSAVAGETLTVEQVDSGWTGGNGHIIDGPFGERTAINTQHGTSARLKVNGNDGFRFNDAHTTRGDFTLNYIVRGPFHQTNNWHTLSRGRHADHQFIWHRSYGHKLGWFKNHGPGQNGWRPISPDRPIAGLFEGEEANKWKQLTRVRQGGTLKIYLDGVLLGSENQPESDNAGIWTIGCYDNNQQRWGPIAEVQYFNYALSEVEVQTLALLLVVPADSFLPSSYRFPATANVDSSVFETFYMSELRIDVFSFKVDIQACNSLDCGLSATSATGIPSTPATVTLRNQGAASDDLLIVNVIDGDDGGTPIVSYQVDILKRISPLIHIPCDDFTGGGACLSTRRYTDDDTCKQNGLHLVVPRSKEHWVYLLENFGTTYMNSIVPGIYRTSGQRNYNNLHMNSESVPSGTWRALDSPKDPAVPEGANGLSSMGWTSPWWLRDSTHGEPNGDYSMGCWLSLNANNVNSITFNDHNCNYASTKYMCSNNYPYYGSDLDFATREKTVMASVETYSVSVSDISLPRLVVGSGTDPFQVQVRGCNLYGCSILSSTGQTSFPSPPDLVAARVTGPSQLSLNLVAPPSISSTPSLEFVIMLKNTLWLDHVTVPSNTFSVNFDDGAIQVLPENSEVTATKANSIDLTGISGPNTDNLRTGVDTKETSMVALSGVTLGTDWTLSAWVKFDAAAAGLGDNLNIPQALVSGDANTASAATLFSFDKITFLKCTRKDHMVNKGLKSRNAQGVHECFSQCQSEGYMYMGTLCGGNNQINCWCGNAVHRETLDSRHCDNWHHRSNCVSTSDNKISEAYFGVTDSEGVQDVVRGGINPYYMNIYVVGGAAQIVGRSSPADSPATFMVPAAIAGDDASALSPTQDSRELGYWTSTTNGGTFFSSGISASDLQNEWVNIGVVASDNAQKFYINGILKGTTTSAYSGPLNLLGGSALPDTLIGNYWSNYFRWGIIGTFQVWPSALPQLQLQAALNIAINYNEQQVVVQGVTSLNIVNDIFTQHPMTVSVFCKTEFGKSYKSTNVILSVPKPPAAATLRVISADRIHFQITVPTNDGGAPVIHWRIVMSPAAAIASVDLAHVEDFVGDLPLDSTNVGVQPRLFQLFSCSLLGCSSFPLTLRTEVPTPPNFANIVNHPDGDKFEVTVGISLSDGGADHDSYKFVASCFPDGAVVVTSTTVQAKNSLTAEANNLFTTMVDSPFTTNERVDAHTCKVDVHACSIVGCSTERRTSWNIGLNSATSAIFLDLIAPLNITVVISSQPEPQKDINPKTTELRWTHAITKETYQTTSEIEEGATKITGLFATTYAWGSTPQAASALSVFLAGSLQHQIERRHCYDSLCGDWVDVLTVLPVPIPGVPLCSTPMGCLQTTALPVGGSVRVEWRPPPYWGEKAIQRGQSYDVTVFYCDPSTSTITVCNPTKYSPTLSYQTTNIIFDVPDLLAASKYTFQINALNGDQPGGITVHSPAIAPIKNKPSKPVVPRVLVTNPESITMEIELPSFNGAPVYDCWFAFAIVGTCGVASAEFSDQRPFVVGDFAKNAEYLYNLGLMYEAGLHVKTSKMKAFSWFSAAAHLGLEKAQQKLNFLNDVDEAENPIDLPVVPPPPAHRSTHTATIFGLKDDVTYSLKLQCHNEIGVSPLSDHTAPFLTPKIITVRNISATFFSIPQEYMELLSGRAKSTANFFSRFPVTLDGGVIYTKNDFCRTHPYQCDTQPFTQLTEERNTTDGRLMPAGWYFGEGNDRYCKKEFAKATCRSIGAAIQATLFDGVTFYLGKGVYRQRGIGNATNETLVKPSMSSDDPHLHLADSETTTAATSNSSNNTNIVMTLPMVHYNENFPIIFPRISPQLVAMDNLDPSEVVIDCGGSRCFDFTPTLNEGQNHPLLRLQGITIRGGQSDSSGGSAIYSPNVKMQEWKYNGVLQTIFVIKSCIFADHISVGMGGAINIFSGSHLESILIPQSWHIIDSTFVNNNANSDGGAINIDSSVMALTNVLFENNTALGYGGALRATSNFVGSAVRATSLRSLTNVAGLGGAVFSVLGANIDIKESEATGDEVLGKDGGAFLIAEASTVKVSNTTLTGLHAVSGSGGAFNVMGSIVEFDQIHVINCRAKSGGGAVSAQLCTVKIKSSSFSNSRVIGSAKEKTSGGALGLYIRTRCKIDDSLFSSNSAAFAGGAIVCDACKLLDINNVKFSDNSAGRGGAVAVLGLEGGLPVSVYSAKFYRNVASVGGGGAIFWDRWPPPVLANKRATLKHVRSITDSVAKGICTDSQYESQRTCEEGGTCSSTSATTRSECMNAGACMEASITTRADCAAASQIWTPAEWKAETWTVTDLIIQENNVGLYGSFIASGPSQIFFEYSDKSITVNTKEFGPHISLRDNYTNQVIDEDEGVSIKVTATSGTSTTFGENVALVSTQGNASFPQFGIAAQPSSMLTMAVHTVTVTSSESSVAEVTFPVTVQDCYKGEFLSRQGEAYACTECPVGLYETKINQPGCTECQAGKYGDEIGQTECKMCPVGLFQAQIGQTKCGDPEIIPSYPTVKDLNRTRDIASGNDYRLQLTWNWPAAADQLAGAKPMVEASTKADFDEKFRGEVANISVVIESKTSAIIHIPKPVFDLVVYIRVRINSGTAVGQWASLLDPWMITSDCDGDNFLNDLGYTHYVPDLWRCEKCPHGSTCHGNVRWGQVKSKFGFWRVDALTYGDDGKKNVDDPTKADFFQQCLFEGACLGAPSTHLAGKFYNLTEGEELNEKSEDMALTDNLERCNWEWGHNSMCSEYGNDQPVRCRLCQSCRQGFKQTGRARCKICPEATANRVLLGVGIVAVIVGFVSVVFMSINSAGTEAEVSEAVKKVLINYLQICSLAALFPLKWPPAIEAIFAMMSAVSSPAQHILSPDCELSWMSGAEAFYNKQLGYAFMPIGVVIICIILWLLAWRINAHKLHVTFAYYYDRIILTVVCILFLLYPTMVKQSLSALACERVGTIYYLAVDLQEVCYETRHFWFVLCVSLPQIALYTVGLPAIATLTLMRHRNQLDDRRVQFRYGILYNGYRRRLYWWELTIAFRKVALVLIAGIYGVRLGPDMQVTVALLLIMLFTASHLVFSPFAGEDQRALPEIPFHIVEKQRLEKLEAKEAVKRSYSMALKRTETTDSDKETPAVKKLKSKYPRLRLLYFKLITSTNMHMIEFGSLAVSGLTLWSGLVFFLNDQKPRMNRFWTEVFSILVAAVNIVGILWMILKYVLAVIKEAHTRTAIEVWADHTMGDLLMFKKLTKGQKMWKRRANLAREWKAKEDAKTESTTESTTESKTESKTRVAPKRLKRQASGWSTLNHDKVHSMATAANTMNDYNGSEARKHQRLAVAHSKAQRKLMNRLKSKYGKNAKKGFRLKKYADISSPNVDSDAASMVSLVEVGTRTSTAIIVPIAANKTVEKLAAKIRVDLGKQMGSEKMLNRVFKRLDTNGSGELEYSEFFKLVQAIEKKDMPTKSVVDYLWELCRGGDDSVTIHKLWMFVKCEDPEMVLEATRLRCDLKSRIATEKLLTKIFLKLDTNGSGTIEFDEFSKLLMAISKVSLPEKLVAYMWELAKDDSSESLTLHQVWIFIHEKQGNFKPRRAKISSENINLLDKAVERSAHI